MFTNFICKVISCQHAQETKEQTITTHVYPAAKRIERPGASPCSSTAGFQCLPGCYDLRPAAQWHEDDTRHRWNLVVPARLISFSIETQPIPKGRPRFTRSGHAFTPQRTRDFESFIKKVAKENVPPGFCYEVPLSVELQFIFKVPKSYSKAKVKDCLSGSIIPKPDLDNLCKAVLDALNNVTFADDSLVVRLKASKRYGDKDLIHIDIRPYL
jgi:Holliday junction resolvase RusA-like endonuclease